MKRIYRCPSCGKQFDITYSRTFGCSGCQYATTGSCGYVRCPFCGHEFPA